MCMYVYLHIYVYIYIYMCVPLTEEIILKNIWNPISSPAFGCIL